MKVGARCGYCLLHRGYRQILRSTDDEAVRKEAIGALLRLMADMYCDEAVPSIIGAERDRLIHRVTVPRPLRRAKEESEPGGTENPPFL